MSSAARVVAALAAAVDGLLEFQWSMLSGPDLVEVLEGLATQRSRLDAVDVQVVVEVEQQRVAGEFGRTSTPELISHCLRVSPREAKARVERARDLSPRPAVSGEMLAPMLPVTAQALTAGHVAAEHTDVIATAMRRVDELPDATVVIPVVERFLVDAARREHPQALRRTAKLLLDRLDPDGVEPREERIFRRRGFTLTNLGDGSAVPSGRWTGEAVAIWDAILDSLAAPKPAADGAADERTAAQRRHDAMVEAGLRLLRSGGLPWTGGTPVTVLVRTDVEDLTAPGGLVQTEHGELLAAAGLLGCGGEVSTVEVGVGAGGEVLNHGRARRLASPAQRRALAVRDGGCCFPGCTRPAAWTEVHHVLSWLDGGPTDLGNLCLLCAHHHREIGRTEWTLVMTDGVPEWLPPPWLDRQRRPVRNTSHHLPDIDFGEVRGSRHESSPAP